LNGRVLVAFLLQVIGYGALLAIYQHSDPASLVEPLQRAPTPLLIPFAAFGVPEVVLATVLGALLSSVGLSAETIPALLVARGDVVVFVAAYGISVAGLRAYRRTRG
jgi:hypothetical protein